MRFMRLLQVIWDCEGCDLRCLTALRAREGCEGARRLARDDARSTEARVACHNDGLARGARDGVCGGLVAVGDLRRRARVGCASGGRKRWSGTHCWTRARIARITYNWDRISRFAIYGARSRTIRVANLSWGTGLPVGQFPFHAIVKSSNITSSISPFACSS